MQNSPWHSMYKLPLLCSLQRLQAKDNGTVLDVNQAPGHAQDLQNHSGHVLHGVAQPLDVEQP